MKLFVLFFLFAFSSATLCGPLDVSVEAPTTWGSGYTGKVTLKNTGSRTVTNWQVVVNIGAQGVLRQSWKSVILTTNGQEVTFGAPSWGTLIVPGASFDLGFNVDGVAGPVTAPVAVSFDGQPILACGGGGNGQTQSQGADTTTTTTTTTVRQSTTTSTATAAPGTLLTSSMVGDSVTRFSEWISRLTTMENNNAYRAVHSSGGAAGGVVSEGQGYGLLMGGLVVASMPANHPKRQWALQTTYELFLGWKRMCQLSAGNGHCQSKFYCAGAPCLPHWKFNDQITSAQGTGSAIDGDEDAMLGMILLARSTDGANRPAFWQEVADHAHQTCKAFFEFGTALGPNGRAPKLGSCWGGWDCSNPSYYAPAAYRACRDYMASRGDSTLNWDLLLKTTYQLASASQCPTNGLVPNWYVPNKASPGTTGTTSCSGSGTPSAEFGAEASRLIWRMAADYVLYGTPESSAFSSITASKLAAKSQGGTRWSNLDTGCLVKSIFSDWSNNAFIYAPLFTSLLVPAGVAGQQDILNRAATKIAQVSINDYYAGSWIAIATISINGDLRLAASALGQNVAGRAVTGTTTTSSAVLPAWAIALIVIGGVAFLVAVAVVIVEVVRRKRRASANASEDIGVDQTALLEQNEEQ